MRIDFSLYRYFWEGNFLPNKKSIQRPQELIGKDPYQIYDDICNITGEKRDLCELDVFLSVVDFMEGGVPVPWWEFTTERKKNR